MASKFRPTSSQKSLFASRLLILAGLTTITLCIFLRYEIVAALRSLPGRFCATSYPNDDGRTSARLTTTPTITRVFGLDLVLEDISAAGDKAWSTKLSTRRGGFLAVRYNQSVNEGWGVSMFHGLHCLSMLREELKTYWRTSNGIVIKGGSEEDAKKGQHQAHESDIGHLRHCLAYIAEVWLILF